jgi:hypothetical protein
MRRARVGLLILVAIGCIAATQQWRFRRLLNLSAAEVVAKRGVPDFIADSVTVARRQLTVLKVQAVYDPQAVTNWGNLSNAAFIWTSTDFCKTNARYFYNDWKNDTNFIGDAWYSSRSLFGEILTVAKLDRTGRVIDAIKVKVDAVMMIASGYVAKTNRTGGQEVRVQVDGGKN